MADKVPLIVNNNCGPSAMVPAGGWAINRRAWLKGLAAEAVVCAWASRGAIADARGGSERGGETISQPSVEFPAVAGPIAVKRVKRLENGVELAMSTGVLRLIVHSPRIIRVLYLPKGATQRPPESLAVIVPPAPGHWTYRASSAAIVVSTPLLRARVDRKTGALTFLDSSGRQFLSEVRAGGKWMTPTRFKGVATCQVHQEFVLPADEALYGLGQHQQGVMNYHGKVVELEQCNRHVAIPILLSNRGYGLFWDNPAITRVNAGTAPPEAIPPEVLVDADGRRGGLTAQFFQSTTFHHPVATWLDSQLTLDTRSTVAGGLPAGDAPAPYSVRYSGHILPEKTGTYTFTLQINGDVQLWIDNRKIAGREDGRPNTTLTGQVDMQAGKAYAIRLEYVHRQELSQLRVLWQVPASKEQAATLTWSSEFGDCIDYYVIRGPKADEVIAAWRDISGPVPMMGKWVWGFWQSKCLYRTQAEILGVAAAYRSMQIPMDGIVQDLFYWQPAPWGSNKFNPERYPSPRAMISQLHDEHLHFMLSVWAAFAPGSANYRELAAAGVLYPSKCKVRYYDAFSPLGRRLYWDHLKTQLFSLGVDAWWLDASEPQLCNHWGEFANIKTFLGWGAFVYNAYPLMHTTAVYQGQRACTSRKRVMILTRSAWAGQQRNSTVIWSGDIPATWQVLREQIPAGINFALTGIPYWNTDIGGFFSGNPRDPAYRELFLRWFAFGAFCPLFRVHGALHAKEMWRFGRADMAILKKFDQLRYRLLTYIYSVAWMVSSRGYTMLRGLVMDFAADVSVLNIGDQYMFGPAILVAPVLHAGAMGRSVYLPADTRWHDFWTGRQYVGGQTIDVPAAVESMPLLIRAGSILPLAPVRQYAAGSADPLEVRVYSGADGSFTLYEDENDNYNYERGVYATFTFTWNDEKRILAIGRRKGTFPGMLRRRELHLVLVRPGRGVGGEPSATDHVVCYTGEPIEVRW
jgi:alpha-D-xyloside xylohydrolase